MSIRHQVAVFILMIMALSMIWSKALLSISFVLMAVLAVMDIRVDPFRVRWVFSFEKIKSSFRSHTPFWVFGLFTLLYFLSVTYAGDLAMWWKLTHPKFAYLLFPMSIVLVGPFNRKEYMLITGCMIIMAVWSALCVMIAYYDEYELFTESLAFGGALPTPTNHIRFATTIAVCMLICIFFALENWKIRFHWERWIYGASAIFLFYFLHILSVRTGILVGYGGLFFLAILYFRRQKQWMKWLVAALLILMPVAAFKLSPSFAKKVGYSLYDLKMFRQGTDTDPYSDARRWISWQAGLEIGNQHPLVGAGPGNFKKELKEYYVSDGQDFSFRPHNQWISVFAIFGLLGLIVFLFMLLYPMTYDWFWKPAIFPALYLTQLITMIFEHPLDTEMGTMLFLMLTLLGMSVQKNFLPNSPPIAEESAKHPRT